MTLTATVRHARLGSPDGAGISDHGVHFAEAGRASRGA
jgi:hypothetical protein